MAQQLKEDGNKLLAAKEYADAEEKYSAALLLGPNVILYSNRALARYLQGKFAESLHDAEECVLLKRDWVKVFQCLVFCSRGLFISFSFQGSFPSCARSACSRRRTGRRSAAGFLAGPSERRQRQRRLFCVGKTRHRSVKNVSLIV
jgi:hypothetical protein